MYLFKSFARKLASALPHTDLSWWKSLDRANRINNALAASNVKTNYSQYPKIFQAEVLFYQGVGFMSLSRFSDAICSFEEARATEPAFSYISAKLIAACFDRYGCGHLFDKDLRSLDQRSPLELEITQKMQKEALGYDDEPLSSKVMPPV